MESKKQCSKCKEIKNLTDFDKNKKGRYGVDCRCKDCKKIISKERYERDKDRILEFQKTYYNTNKEIILEKNKDYYNKNKDKVIDKQKEYYTNNKEKKLNQSKLYREGIKDKLRVYKRNYERSRKNSDPFYKLSSNIRSLIIRSIKRGNYTKKSRTFELLGCTFEEFKFYIEEKFTGGMNWENQGEWELDHIYPISLAKDEEELIKLSHHTNFQPLWKSDNRIKSNKLNK